MFFDQYRLWNGKKGHLALNRNLEPFRQRKRDEKPHVNALGGFSAHND